MTIPLAHDAGYAVNQPKDDQIKLNTDPGKMQPEEVRVAKSTEKPAVE